MPFFLYYFSYHHLWFPIVQKDLGIQNTGGCTRLVGYHAMFCISLHLLYL